MQLLQPQIAIDKWASSRSEFRLLSEPEPCFFAKPKPLAVVLSDRHRNETEKQALKQQLIG